MILDKQNLFSDDQAVTVTANSTNIIDLGNDAAAVQALNEKGVLQVFVQVTTAFASGTSIALTLTSDDALAHDSPTTILSTAAIAQAALVAGYQFRIPTLPVINEQYLRLTYTVVGTFDAGNIMAGLILDRQTNN